MRRSPMWTASRSPPAGRELAYQRSAGNPAEETAFIDRSREKLPVAGSGYSMNSNQRVRIPYSENEKWGWTAVAVLFAFLLGAIAIYSPPDLADRSTTASLGHDETTGRAAASQ